MLRLSLHDHPFMCVMITILVQTSVRVGETQEVVRNWYNLSLLNQSIDARPVPRARSNTRTRRTTGQPLVGGRDEMVWRITAKKIVQPAPI